MDLFPSKRRSKRRPANVGPGRSAKVVRRGAEARQVVLASVRRSALEFSTLGSIPAWPSNLHPEDSTPFPPLSLLGFTGRIQLTRPLVNKLFEFCVEGSSRVVVQLYIKGRKGSGPSEEKAELLF